jgi:hypothetical protein
VLLELWMLLWLGARLWQRAGETAWYQRTQIPTTIEPITPVIATTMPGEPAPGFATGSQ